MRRFLSKKKLISKYEAMALFSASIVAAVTVWAASIIATRVLDVPGFAQFQGVFWPIVFAIFGIISGIQQETTRAVGNQLQTDSDTKRTLVVPPALMFGLGGGLLVLISAPFWSATYLPQFTWPSVLLISLTVVLFSVQTALAGAAAGLGKWFLFAGLGGVEAAWRLLALVLAAVFAGSVFGLEVAVVSASFIWVVFVLLSRDARNLFRARADVPAGRFARNIGLATVSSFGSAVLTAGFPFALLIIYGSATPELNALIAVIGITRSPIMIPLLAFQGVAIAAFLRHKEAPFRAMFRPLAAIFGLGIFGAILAFFLGPTLFDLLYKNYAGLVPGVVLAALTFGGVFMGSLVLSGTAALAVNVHKVYTTGWVTAVVVSIGLLFVPIGLVERTLLALYLGPLIGVVIHLLGIKSKVATRENS
ncbi:hypothetical membrane protein [Renibacterium salmoninarum ATCC 33209]|uniref:Hypothetical membrane protein n=1 Tax=Renibacterium salmoninarum (strain ATCC 33209 / DSM 20767 / JCM 11484 / NBRC 15589 / NCIMB 2235) TaxID=288705 RepID=A9WV05_RENSM|nr:hypothetical membrane protein [Renibacterium salmoninarum ATCC 33209]